MKTMSMVTHADDTNVPKGFACLCINDSGWVGTNNGFPFAGQPALFPIAQAHAITYAWNGFALKGADVMVPHLDDVPEDVQAWLK